MNQEISKTEEKEIQELIENLGDISTHVRKNAREKLVAKGIIIKDYIVKLLDHQIHTYRWEAMKILEEIAHPEFTPIFIQALEDDESDIRWIAAEGLARLKDQSIKPILKRIIENDEHSIFLYSGVHHVFSRLKKKGLFSEEDRIEELLLALKHHKATGDIKTHAHRILRRVES